MNSLLSPSTDGVCRTAAAHVVPSLRYSDQPGKPDGLSDFFDQVDAAREAVGGMPTPLQQWATPMDFEILSAAAYVAEQCVEFLELARDGRFFPRADLPLPDPRCDFVVRCGGVQGIHRPRGLGAAKRYARLWLGRPDAPGVNVKIMRVEKTVEARYSVDSVTGVILANHPARADQVRDAGARMLACT